MTYPILTDPEREMLFLRTKDHLQRERIEVLENTIATLQRIIELQEWQLKYCESRAAGLEA